MIPGCPETFQSSQSQFDRRQRFRDRHQKIGHCREGDIIAFPAGAAHWVYNEGDQELVLVVLQDTTNNINQLDTNPRVRKSPINFCFIFNNNSVNSILHDRDSLLPGTRKAKDNNSNKGNGATFSGDLMLRLYLRHLMSMKKLQENFNVKMIKEAILLELIRAFTY